MPIWLGVKTVSMFAFPISAFLVTQLLGYPLTDVLLFTLPDPVKVNPLARAAATRLRTLNVAVRDFAARHGAFVVDLDLTPVASDPRLWALDRLHANPEGHRRIAAAAGHTLRLPGD